METAGFEIAVFGDSETILGFKLAGVTKAIECKPVERADELFNSLLKDEGVGLVLAQDDLMPLLSTKTRKQLEALSKPIVLTIPSKKSEAGVESLARLVKKAIGVELIK